MKIAVAAVGYVGLSLSVLLAQRDEVVGYDIDADRIEQLNRGLSPLSDPDIIDFLAHRELDLRFTTEAADAYAGADFVVVATPTDYDAETNGFNTETVRAVVADVIATNPTATIVIKSTVPVGFSQGLRDELGLTEDQLVFSPEFLREGKALYDNLHPSRIIVGGHGPRAKAFGALLRQASLDPQVPVLHTSSTEAEAIKLFSNTYLAMRVAYFNELDTFASSHGLDVRTVVEGVGLDPRIGPHYNNPSFGYGGYCLPKDSKQLLASYADIPQHLVRATVESNATRMDFVADEVMARRPKRVGVYRLVMKSGSDNYRESSVIGVIDRLRDRGVELLIHEPLLTEGHFREIPVTTDLAELLDRCDLILANRVDAALEPVADKVYTRDLFGTI
ncbi:MAG TPA: nucleotide sugar dehydrogenase [Candidatus Avipropionibacterium avicola]|uniref:UDP-glucose 6-dehydrogenase n=1 Tax=Candidatus Avipropionibacterium avicola TaxID=2840701 RepID=A0A9D1GXZ0_9ACTN|nr:nucleotide sugar dehydrogenase [Candidatus Avipropionibacterium avicola]